LSDHDLYFGDFERAGEDAVRNNLAAGRYNGKHRNLADEWLRRLDQARADAAMATDLELARRGTEAAEGAASSAREANRIARDARNISYFGAVVALVAAGLSFIALFLRI